MIKISSQVCLIVLATTASFINANEQADQQRVVFTNSSVLVDDLEVGHLNNGYIDTDPSRVITLNSDQAGWTSFSLTIREDDDGAVMLPSGQNFPLSDLFSLSNDQAWFWIPCEEAGCPEGGVEGKILFSHTNKKNANSLRNLVMNQLKSSSNSYISEKGLSLSAIYISVPDSYKAMGEYTYGSSDSSHDHFGDQHGRPGQQYIQKGELPLFNQMDSVFDLLSIASSEGVLGGIPIIRSKRPLMGELLPPPNKRDYMMEQVIRHRDQVVQVNMLFLPITPQASEGASPTTPLQPMQKIMNWLPTVLRNANEVYRIHARLFRASGLAPVSLQNFQSIYITEECELKTQLLLDLWLQNIGDQLAEKLKPILIQMRLQQPDSIKNAFRELVTVEDMQMGEEVVVNTSRKTVHNMQDLPPSSEHSSCNPDLIFENASDIMGSKDSSIIGMALKAPDGGISVVKKDKENTSKVKGDVAKVHTLEDTRNLLLERRGTYEKDGRMVTAFDDMSAQSREHSYKKPKKDNESGGTLLGFGWK